MKIILCILLMFLSAFAEERRELKSEDLPSYIKRIQSYGERVDFNFDATKVIYVTKPRGEVEELNLKTGKITQITADLPRKKDVGFFRCSYLINGELLLTGGMSRRECTFYVVSKDRKKLTKINEPCWEGAAVSRTSMNVAWTPNHIVLYKAELKYKDGAPYFDKKEEVLTTSDSFTLIPEYQNRKTKPGQSLKTYIEPQNFVPGQEHILTFTHYGKDPYHAESLSINLNSKEITHLSKDKEGKHFDAESEGAFSSGGYTTVESTYLNEKGQHGCEILRMKVDGSERPVRLTYFSKIWNRFKATNPVISDDGKWMAFQHGIMWDNVAGKGYGLYIMDLEKAYKVLGISSK